MTEHAHGMGKFEGTDVRGLVTDVVLPRRFLKSPADPNVWLLLYEYDPGKMYHVRPGQDMLDTPSFMSCGIREAGSNTLVGNFILLSEMIGSAIPSIHYMRLARKVRMDGVYNGKAGSMYFLEGPDYCILFNGCVRWNIVQAKIDVL